MQILSDPDQKLTRVEEMVIVLGTGKNVHMLEGVEYEVTKEMGELLVSVGKAKYRKAEKAEEKEIKVEKAKQKETKKREV
jgi:hypothetical protein